MSEDMIKIAQEQARLRQELEEKLQDIQGRPGSDNLEKSLKDLIKNMEKNVEKIIYETAFDYSLTENVTVGMKNVYTKDPIEYSIFNITLGVKF